MSGQIRLLPNPPKADGDRLKIGSDPAFLAAHASQAAMAERIIGRKRA